MNKSKKEIIISGECISPGIAYGEIFIFDVDINSDLNIENFKCSNALDEIDRFNSKILDICLELESHIESLKKKEYFEEANILETHLYILRDDNLRKKVQEKIHSNSLVTESAVKLVFKDLIDVLNKSDNLVFKERALDFKDIAMRFNEEDYNDKKTVFSKILKNITNPIVIVEELYPSFILESQNNKISGFLVKKGSSYSHAAILAKSFGIPVLKIDSISDINIKDNDRVCVNAENQELIIYPSEKQDYKKDINTNKNTNVSKDLPVNLWINIVDPSQIDTYLSKNIKGIGLYRTEILFMNKKDFPSEQEQINTYKEVFDKCNEMPVTIRTLDIGGDKMLPYFLLGHQENPYLGFRAHRIFRYHPEIFITQIRAILQASLNYNNDLRIMYPMIETMDDLLFVKDLFNEAVSSLKKDNLKYHSNFLLGIMIEVPSIIWILEDVYKIIDFASIGSNDLLQYIFAIDRNNANVNDKFQSDNPVTLRVFKQIIDISEKMNKHLSICGEIASQSSFLPILLGLGIKNISIDIHSIEHVLKELSELNLQKCKDIFHDVNSFENQAQIDKALRLLKINFKHETKHKNPNLKYIDPICKMEVSSINSKYKTIYDDKEYYFCCERCRKEFIELNRLSNNNMQIY